MKPNECHKNQLFECVGAARSRPISHKHLAIPGAKFTKTE
jgi:hypothetical protein